MDPLGLDKLKADLAIWTGAVSSLILLFDPLASFAWGPIADRDSTSGSRALRSRSPAAERTNEEARATTRPI